MYTIPRPPNIPSQKASSILLLYFSKSFSLKGTVSHVKLNHIIYLLTVNAFANSPSFIFFSRRHTYIKIQWP
jgi:hypothetical protein